MRLENTLRLLLFILNGVGNRNKLTYLYGNTSVLTTNCLEVSSVVES